MWNQVTSKYLLQKTTNQNQTNQPKSKPPPKPTNQKQTKKHLTTTKQKTPKLNGSKEDYYILILLKWEEPTSAHKFHIKTEASAGSEGSPPIPFKECRWIQIPPYRVVSTAPLWWDTVIGKEILLIYWKILLEAEACIISGN